MRQKTVFSPGDRLLGMKEVLDIVRISRARIYKMMNDGDFPRPVKIGDRRVAWIEAEIINYINRRIVERDSRS